MSDIEAAARELAEAMGWEYHERHVQRQGPYFVLSNGGLAHIPSPESPLRDRLAFVGELAEACGLGLIEIADESSGGDPPYWSVTFEHYGRFDKSLPHAAILAATAAVRSRT